MFIYPILWTQDILNSSWKFFSIKSWHTILLLLQKSLLYPTTSLNTVLRLLGFQRLKISLIEIWYLIVPQNTTMLTGTGLPVKSVGDVHVHYVHICVHTRLESWGQLCGGTREKLWRQRLGRFSTQYLWRPKSRNTLSCKIFFFFFEVFLTKFFRCFGKNYFWKWIVENFIFKNWFMSAWVRLASLFYWIYFLSLISDLIALNFKSMILMRSII